MKKYVFLFSDSYIEIRKLSNEGLQLYLEKWLRWIKNLKESNIYLAGEPVEAPGRLIAGRQKAVTVLSDDTFQEVCTGVIIIEARNIEYALEIGLQCPIFEVNGKLSIHQVRDMDI